MFFILYPLSSSSICFLKYCLWQNIFFMWKILGVLFWRILFFSKFVMELAEFDSLVLICHGCRWWFHFGIRVTHLKTFVPVFEIFWRRVFNMFQWLILVQLRRNSHTHRESFVPFCEIVWRGVFGMFWWLILVHIKKRIVMHLHMYNHAIVWFSNKNLCFITFCIFIKGEEFEFKTSRSHVRTDVNWVELILILIILLWFSKLNLKGITSNSKNDLID